MLFIYLDESGNYTFSAKGSEFLIYSALTTRNPYEMHHKLCELEKELKKQNAPLGEYFHATEDKQEIRNAVYNTMKQISGYEIDTVIVEKCKVNPSIREFDTIYKKVYSILLKFILRRYPDVTKIILFIDEPAYQHKKEAAKKGIKETLSDFYKAGKIKYHISYLPSVFSYGLQATDYCCWAFKKKWGDWGGKDLRPYKEIVKFKESEMDLFEKGDGYKHY